MGFAGDHPKRLSSRPLSCGRRGVAALLIALLACVLAGCSGKRHYPNRPIILICPWAAGGGTDRCARQVAALLERELDVPVNVVNATGGAGVTGHTRGALARPDGYTLTMVTVEINMLHWRGLTSISHRDYTPVGLLNRDAAAVFVRSDATWQSPEQLAAHVRAHPGKLKVSGTAKGGIWHLAFAGWLHKIGLRPSDAIWISINGSAPSLQELLAGGVDVVCCSLPEAQSLLDAGRVRCLGVMADHRLDQFANVPTFKEQGVDWTLGCWRGICLPKETPADVTERVVAALERMAKSETFLTFMRDAGFEADWQPPVAFGKTMQDFDERLGAMLTSESFRSVRRTQFSPMFFPKVLAVMLVLVLGGLVATGGLKRPASIIPITKRGLLRLGEVVACVLAYVLLAEWAGFVVTAAVLLMLLAWRMGARWPVAAAVSVLIVPLAYQVFAVSLRVPLPRGWLGW